MCNSKYNAHTDPLYFDSKILNLNDLFKLSCAKMVHKKTQGKLHNYHSSQIIIKSEFNDLETRQKHDVNLKLYPSNCLRINSINYKFGKAWNELPFSIKDKIYKTSRTFSKHVKEFYLSKYDKHCEIMNCYICNSV